MTSFAGQPGGTQTIDVKVAVPELPAAGTFWVRDCPADRTFAELYQECVNHPAVVRSPDALEPVRASRHFWHGSRFLRRDDTLHTLLAAPARSTEGLAEISLILRRDYYRLGPPGLVAGGREYTYIDAEDRIERVVPSVLDKDQKPCCFDLCDWRRRRLAANKSLADYELWPAWQDAGDFPDRASLRLRPRTGWLAYGLLLAAVLCGYLLGYSLWRVALGGS